ncbi:hypothetical protein A2U01_0028768 [Trifolium medium]|uniref:Uncharacterized protein n=1 Tax=Trifolium medium TaxID=97028 RepID=A0A392P899_9FABA|nr:hypothetical protein [Trifolium medium]
MELFRDGDMSRLLGSCKPIATCHVISLAFQNVAEIDPSFVEQYRSELVSEWKIWNEQITDGWASFCKRKRMKGNVEVELVYL